jgi:hypothetical protein
LEPPPFLTFNYGWDSLDAGPQHALHGGPVRDPLQRDHPEVLPTSGVPRQKVQGCDYRLHAKDPRHPEHPCKERLLMVATTAKKRLKTNTVMLPKNWTGD